MAIFNKPEFNSVWGATGVKLTPDSAKISQGWVVEIPPYEYENWSANRQDALLAHLNQFGIPSWDATAEYQAGKSYVQGGTTGVVYRALTTNTNVNPETDVSNNWQIAFESSATALLKSQNLADVPDKALARVNLGIATTEFYDGRYLVKTNNLADVPNKATARNNIDVYGKSDTFSRTEIEALFPAGVIEYHASSNAIAGRVLAQGQAVSRTTYSKLFARIGTYFGAGNGTTTFNLPDGRGTFPRGLDSGRGLDAGRTLGSFQGSQNISHNHGINDPWHGHGINDPGHIHGVPASVGNSGNGPGFDASAEAIYGYNNTTASGTGISINGSPTGISINNSGGSEARPVNTAWTCFITTGLLT